MSLQCYILSGISGSGKTTWIQNQPWAKNADIHSADHFFIQPDGSYRFDSSQLGKAFDACLLKFLRGIRNGWHAQHRAISLDGMAVQVVDNTNTTTEEIAPYYALAKAHGYEVTLVTLWMNYDLAAIRTAHNVPMGTCKKMHTNLINRNIPKWWTDLKKESYVWVDDGWTLV